MGHQLHHCFTFPHFRPYLSPTNPTPIRCHCFILPAAGVSLSLNFHWLVYTATSMRSETKRRERVNEPLNLPYRDPEVRVIYRSYMGHIQVIHGSYTSPPIHHIEIERYLRMREAPNNQGKGKDPEFPKYDSARIRRSRRKHPEVSAVGTQTSCAIRLAPNRVPVFRILMSQCIDRINV